MRQFIRDVARHIARDFVSLLWFAPALIAWGVTGANAQEKPGAKTAPTFSVAWRLSLPGDVKRIAVGDVKEPMIPRLVAADSKGRVTVYRLQATGDKTGVTVEEVGSIASVAGSDRMEVGHFGKGRPTGIAVPGAVYVYDGAAFRKTDLPELPSINGFARFADGREMLIAWALHEDPTTWTLDTAIKRRIRPGWELVSPDSAAGVMRITVIRGSAEFLAELDAAGDFGKAGVIGSFDPRGDGGYWLWSPKVTADGSYFTVSSVDAKPIWSSPRFEGRILDVAHGADPSEPGRTGVFLLISPKAGAPTVVQFLALDSAAAK